MSFVSVIFGLNESSVVAFEKFFVECRTIAFGVWSLTALTGPSSEVAVDYLIRAIESIHGLAPARMAASTSFRDFVG